MNTVLAVVICLALVGVIIFISISKKVDNVSNSDMDNTNVNEPVENDSGRSAKEGDVVSVNYTGRFTNGTAFDSNVDPNFHHVEPFTFTLGAGNVIVGWDKGIVGMKVGEKRTLTIFPDEGYGSTDQRDRAGNIVIPANSTLIFDVELLAIN